MKPFGFAIVLASVVLGAVQAWPQAKGDTDPCRNSATEATLRSCRRAALDASQARLERSVAALRASYSTDEPVKAKLLEEAQAAWLRFRDAQCRFVNADSASGTAADIYLATCLAEQNDGRSKELERVADMP